MTERMDVTDEFGIDLSETDCMEKEMEDEYDGE